MRWRTRYTNGLGSDTGKYGRGFAYVQVGSANHPDLASYSGRTVRAIAESLGVPAIEVFFEILVKDRLATSCLMHIGNEENVRKMMMDEQHCSGSDAILHGKQTHPRVRHSMTSSV
jgi:N-acyl-D-aspartate/D-glutamate deacylase